MKEYVDKLHKSYQMAISAFMDAYPKTDVFLIKQIDNYSRACALYIWTLSDNKPEQYIEPINVIYSEKVGSPNYTIENVKAAIDKLNSRSRSMPVPKFFDRIIDYDLRHMTNYSGRLVRCFQLLNVCYSLFDGAVNKEEAGSMAILQMELSQACNKKGIIPFLLDDPYEYIMPVEAEELFVNASNMQLADINILKSPDYNSRAGRIVVPLGIDDDAKLITCDLGLIPHMLVCGFTGTGKTALIQTILAIMISKKKYQDVKVAIYDSKHLDYMDFYKLPHLYSPVATDKDGATKLIDRIESEIHKRFLFLRDINCRDYRQYYEKREEMSDRMPELFFIFDDFSSLVLQPEEKDKLLYILINGRVVGVHVILITSTIVSKTLKLDILSHIPVRISFRVTSKAESRMALDQPGAEALAIPGEIIFKNQNEYLKCWCVHAENNNIKQVLSTHSYKTNDIDELGKMATYCFRGLKNASNKNETESVSKDFEDDLLYDAGALICDMQKASITMLQRKLGIGFNRAARIMDRLEELDVVGKEEALKPRDILMTAEEWKDFYDSMVRKKNGL